MRATMRTTSIGEVSSIYLKRGHSCSTAACCCRCSALPPGWTTCKAQASECRTRKFFSRGGDVSRRSGSRLDARPPSLARRINVRPSLRRASTRGPRHVPQVVLILDVLFLFRLKAIALQHRVNHRRCHHHPFDRHTDIDCERASGGARVW